MFFFPNVSILYGGDSHSGMILLLAQRPPFLLLLSYVFVTLLTDGSGPVMLILYSYFINNLI